MPNNKNAQQQQSQVQPNQPSQNAPMSPKPPVPRDGSGEPLKTSDDAQRDERVRKDTDK